MALINDEISVAITANASKYMSEMGKVKGTAKEAEGAFEKLGAKIGITGDSLKKALGFGGVAAIGVGLFKFIEDSISAFGDYAKAADDLAQATGSNATEISKLQAALEDAGVSAEKSAGLLTKFTTNVPKNADDLAKLNVELQKNKDGSVNYAATMVLTVDAINKVGDAAERNRLLNEFFGKSGKDVFNDMKNSGMDLAEAMELISKYRIIDPRDVTAAKDYDAALDNFKGSVQGLQFEIGRALLPVLSTFAGILEDVVGAVSGAVGVFEKLPDPVKDAAAAFVIFAGGLALLEGAGVFAAIATGVEMFTTSVVVMGGVLPVVTAGVEALTIALLTNPIVAFAVAAAAVVALVAFSSAQHKKDLERNVNDVIALEAEGMKHAEAVRQVAEESERSKPKGRKATEGGFEGKELRDTIKEINDAYDENAAKMGETEAAQKKLSDSTKSLKDALLEGGHSAQELGEMASSAAESQGQLDAATRQSEGAIEAYASITWDAVHATESMFDATHRYETAQRDLTEAVKDYNKEPTADNLQAVVEQVWDLAAASDAAWLAEEKRYGRMPSDTQIEAHHIESLKNAIATLPKGGKAAQETGEQFARELAAWATSHPTELPVGIDMADVDTAIAGVKTQIADAKASGNTTLEGDLNIDLTQLTTLKTNMETGTATTVPMKVDVANLDETKTDLDNLGVAETKNVTLNTEFTPGGYEAIKARKDYLAAPATGTVTINTAFEPGGYEGVKARLDYLTSADGKTPDISVWTHFEPGGYGAVKDRLDYILSKDGASPDITIWTHFEPGGYGAIADRIRFIDQDRSATISLSVKGADKLKAANQSIAGLAASADLAQTLNLAQQIKMPAFPPMPTPINIVKVNVDGRQLKAVIREELGQVRASDDLVAAMGVRA